MAAVGARVCAAGAEVISSPRGCLDASGGFSRPPTSTPGAVALDGASRVASSTPSSRPTMGGDWGLTGWHARRNGGESKTYPKYVGGTLYHTPPY